MLRPRTSATLIAFLLSLPALLSAQTGTIELTARAAPTIGNAEPVRKQTFYLLLKSYAGIRQEAAESEPGPDLDKYVETSQVSAELRAWMKRAKRVELSGPEFQRALKPDDIMGVPEFRSAYRTRNMGDVPFGFPEPKYKEKDRVKNPKKFAQQEQAYLKALRQYLDVHPQSVEGIENHLAALDTAVGWARLMREWQNRVDWRARQLAESRYLAARMETDLEGNARLSGLAPGRYWISSLNNYAQVGDVRLAWDLPLDVLPDRPTFLELSNVNAIAPSTARH